MRLFLSRREIDRAPLADEPRPVRQVGVVGAGLMGAGVAFVTAEVARLQVRFKDRDDDRVADALRRVRTLFQQEHDRGRLGAMELERRWHRVTATTDWRGFERCDVVIESVNEDLDLKRQILREVEAVGREDLVFASTTSAIPIAALAEASRHPETVVGMHYFSPVPRIPLLEVVAGPATSPRVVATAVALGRQQGKTVIVVRDGPGFYTTRILAPMLSEAGHLVSEGVPIPVVDAALQDFGFPVGPFRLLDEIGIDVSAKVNALLAEAHGERIAPWAGLRWLVDDRRYGRKNQRGFYRWSEGQRGDVDASVYAILGVTPRTDVVPSEDLAWRCVLRLVNEAVHCHGEGVLRATRDGDVGAVLALGFPAFHGGPFRLVDALGAREIVERLRGLRERYGARFEPAPLLVELADTGAAFYGADAPAPGARPLPVRKAR
jgi:3-hydroxyacyl-CoA dehydrogenase/enoyl-CoA hydratase/3-hydroxybutyryl-CoA epimerase